MNRGQEARLRVVETAIRSSRTFIIAGTTICGEPLDVEAEMEELRREHGMTDADKVIIACWPGPKDKPAARG